MDDGIYYDMSEEDYRALPFANYSNIKILCKGGTPAHYKAAVDGGEKVSKAMQFGKFAHIAILEPERIKTFQPLPPTVKTRKGKDYDQLCLDNPDITYHSPSEWREVVKHIESAWHVQQSVLSNPRIVAILEQAKSEVVLIWTDIDTQVRCKARLDLLSSEIADLKTTSYSVSYQVGRCGYKLGYHIQSAFYTDGHTTASGGILSDPFKFSFIFIESSPPYLVSIFDGHGAYDERDEKHHPYIYLEMGRGQYKDALKTIKMCQKSGEWPGHVDDPEMVIPKYAGWEGM